MLTALGCQVDIAVFDLARMPEKDQTIFRKKSTVPLHDLKYGGLIRLDAILRLVRLIRSLKIDIVHCHGYKADILGLLAARLTGCRVIATCHNWTNATAALRRYSSLDLKALRYFDCVVAVSDPVSRQLLEAGANGEKLLRIDNGIDVASYSTEPPTPTNRAQPVLGVVSRLSTEKGLDVLIRALPQVVADYPSLVCRIVGQGPEHLALLDLASEMHVASHVHFEGFHSDVRTFLSECTIVALPSRTEGTPMAVLEAMASRRPVIASAVGNVPHLLMEGAAGVLVAPDNPDELAQGILTLLQNPDLRNRITGRAHEHVAMNFDLRSVAKRYLNIYNDLCPRATKAMVSQYE
jgi:glycosyltransferase involved in cell wall biosynthesis